jgi:UDP-N-acetyl-D-mannosaminuronic acid transferase (WecB/TagA/CpsF family)
MYNTLFNINFYNHSIESLFYKQKFTHVVTVNNEYIYRYNKDSSFKNYFDQNSVFICDGRIPFYWSKIRFKKILNATGIDLIAFLYSTKIYINVLFIGDEQVYNDQIVDLFQKKGFNAAGFIPDIHSSSDFCNYSFDFNGYDVVFVALGCDKQEQYISIYKEKMISSNVKLVSGIGGAYRIFLGHSPLPRIVYTLGLGSFWRFLQEFNYKRFKRILISILALKYYN